MAIAEQKSPSDGKVWGFFKLPFRQSGNTTNTTSSSSSTHNAHHHSSQVEGSNLHTSNSVSSVARSLLPTRRRLKLDPPAKLYFPCTPLSRSFLFNLFHQKNTFKDIYLLIRSKFILECLAFVKAFDLIVFGP